MFMKKTSFAQLCPDFPPSFSFERYVRICYLCQLRPSTLITSENFKYYVVGILVGPMIFYTPKFFEVEPSVQTTKFFSQVSETRQE